MSRIDSAISEFQSIDLLARDKRWTSSVAPLAKLSVTVFYIVLVVSFYKYDLAGLLGMALYPVVLFTLADLSFRDALRRMKVVLPFVLILGAANPFFDRQIVFSLFGIGISGGVLSWITLAVKAVLTVLSSYLLIATTPIEELCRALRQIHFPQILVTELLLIYRYITVLLAEARRVVQAYSLRAPGQKGVAFRAWGSLAGQMLLRSMDRADTLYASMQLRGYTGEFPPPRISISRKRTAFYVIAALAGLLVLRIVPVLTLLGGLFT